MTKPSLVVALAISVLLSGRNFGHGPSHGPDGSHVPKAPEAQKPADHHKSID